MAECHKEDCDKSLPGDDVPACNACLFQKSPAEVVKDKRKVPSDFDLSYYETPDDGRHKNSGRSVYQVRGALSQLAKARPQELQEPEKPMDMMKVKSNSYRSRSLLHEDLVLFFDDSGVAEVPSHERACVERLMMHRPGRFQIIEDDAQKAKKPAPDMEALRKRAEESRKKVEAKPEEKKDEAEAASEKSEEKTSSDSDTDKSSKPKRRTKKKSSSSK